MWMPWAKVLDLANFMIVYLKHPEIQRSPIKQQLVFQDAGGKPLSKNFLMKLRESDECDPACKEFLTMLSEFWRIWNNNQDRITTTKPRIEVLHIHTKPIQVLACWAGPKTRQSEKAEIVWLLESRIIAPVQAEWAAPVLFTPNKNEHL